MNGIFHPTRDGARGGRDQFSWDQVKDDKYRENYLGHSVLAPVGRWQKGKDLTWYAKQAQETGKTAEQIEAEELEKIKLQEAELLAEALGYKGPKKHLAPPSISTAELKQAIKKEAEIGEEMASPLTTDDAHGLGFGKKGTMTSAPATARLEGVGNLSEFRPATGTNAVPVNRRPSPSQGAAFSKADEEERKRRKKQEKEEKRQRKKERKEEKERRKRERGEEKDKARKRHSSDDSDSSDDDRGHRRRSPTPERPRKRHDTPEQRRSRSRSRDARRRRDGDRKDSRRDRSRSRSRSPARGGRDNRMPGRPENGRREERRRDDSRERRPRDNSRERRPRDDSRDRRPRERSRDRQ